MDDWASRVGVSNWSKQSMEAEGVEVDDGIAGTRSRWSRGVVVGLAVSVGDTQKYLKMELLRICSSLSCSFYIF